MPDSFIKIAAIISVVISGFALADTETEIEHLLKFVASTSCQYERNGTLYDGAEAKSHIQKKYDHFRHKIKSSEEFIKYSATNSTMSGKKYKIHCENTPIQNSSDWLLDELKKYRQKQSS